MVETDKRRPHMMRYDSRASLVNDSVSTAVLPSKIKENDGRSRVLDGSGCHADRYASMRERARIILGLSHVTTSNPEFP